MTPDLRAALINCTHRRALAYGATATTDEARRRYFRELAACYRLLGEPAEHFDALG